MQEGDKPEYCDFWHHLEAMRSNEIDTMVFGKYKMVQEADMKFMELWQKKWRQILQPPSHFMAFASY